MNSEIKHIHHVGHVVTNMDAALEFYRRLGFDCPPPAYPALAEQAGETPKLLGAGNTHVAFHRNFIEIVAVVKEGEALPADANIVPLQVSPELLQGVLASIKRTVNTIDCSLARFEGTHILCLHTSDTAISVERFDLTGVGHSGVNKVKRPIETTKGKQVVPVHYVEIDGEAVPEGRLAIAENPSEEIMQTQTRTDHPNGALELLETYLCVDDSELESVVRRYQRYLGHQARSEGKALTFELEDGARITIVTPSEIDDWLPDESAPPLPGFAGYTVAVRDIAATRAYLEVGGIKVRETASGGIMVPASVGLGTAIVFCQADGPL